MNFELLFLAATFIWLIGLTVVNIRRFRLFEQISKRGSAIDLVGILAELDKRIKANEQQTKITAVAVADLTENGLRHIQKIGFVRFNPFSDTGGEQSFVLSLLDAQDNGVVITVLHARGGTRWYTKLVEKGIGRDLQLSGEEKLAIKEARWPEQIGYQKKYALKGA